MRTAGRIRATIDCLHSLFQRPEPLGLFMRAWAREHRYAGSHDRAFISGLLLGCFRHRGRAVWVMEDDSARAVVLYTLCVTFFGDSSELEAALTGPYAPAPLTYNEKTALDPVQVKKRLAVAPPWGRGSYPEWMQPHMLRAFGADHDAQTKALLARAPLDLRVNTRLIPPERLAAQLGALDLQPGRHDPHCLRCLALPFYRRPPPFDRMRAFAEGLFEIQDEGSQLAARCIPAKAAQGAILDACCGAGGKALAIAARLPKATITAYDSDSARQSGMFARLQRSGCSNIRILSAAQGDVPVAGHYDVVFLDVPCSGSGAWRRRPQQKWRLRPKELARRIRAQDALLAWAHGLLPKAGWIVYVTCSLWQIENDERVETFLQKFPDCVLEDPRQALGNSLGANMPNEALRRTRCGIALSPHQTQTDGFFVALLRKG